MEQTLEKLADAAKAVLEVLGSRAVTFAVLGLVALVVLIYVLRMFVRRGRPSARVEPELQIDVADLGAAGPPDEAPVLECYHVPVRLAALVLAPAGRDRDLPPPEELADMAESVAPGLAAVIASHEPRVYRWPPQLSTEGFVHRFFAHVSLPGDAGKGTPWCSAAGVFRFAGRNSLAGLVMRAGSDVHLGQQRIERPEKWLDVLRVKQ